ncbi:MAG: hypothetical protein ACREFP_26645 [Acetobacteraceae bacterium]
MPVMRSILARSTVGLLASLAWLSFANPAAASGGASPVVGTWVGAVAQGQRNIVVKLTLKSAVLGSRDGEMRWGAPRSCSLKTEYAGMRAGDYLLNIFSTDGGWCDLYRDGTLALRPATGVLDFTLKDKQDQRATTGQLNSATQ